MDAIKQNIRTGKTQENMDLMRDDIRIKIIIHTHTNTHIHKYTHTQAHTHTTHQITLK